MVIEKRVKVKNHRKDHLSQKMKEKEKELEKEKQDLINQAQFKK